MEEARYWMWAKSKVEADSWEEQAFAEDAAGVLGGCVWPPRSYSCSFCRRDFRSAQALGGHMNVHRRDKARLKQSPNPAASEVGVPLSPCTSFDPSHSSQMCTSFLFNNPNPSPNTEFSDSGPFASGLIRAPSPPSPTAAKVNNSHEKVSSTLRFFPCNYVQKSDNGSLVSLGHPPSWSGILSEKRDCVREDLSMSLNLVGCESRRNTCGEEEEVGILIKRRRMEAKPLSFLPTLRSAVERCLPQVQPEVLKLCSAASTSAAAAEDLDLELRLGYAPKVK